ncbi:MAG TPA: glycine--tRNA ligase, partial [Verrucomicrobiae bacterium]|nr:glycine--tRNA ligase [Verrucomicrobiae bacterium]
MDTAPPDVRVTMEEVAALAKRRGFVFQSSEIYGGINGFWDYGPLGAVLKRNVKNAWWRDTVELRDDVVAFDSSIVMHPLTWKASGHVDQFHD